MHLASDPWKGLRDTCAGILDMSIRGAGKIARAASGALSDFARQWEGGSIDEFREDLKKAALELHTTRPSAVSLRNGILLTLKGVEKEDDLDTMRERVIENARAFIGSSHRSVESIGEFGCKRIPPDSTVMTHCNSSAALSVIEKGFREGRVTRVFATESRPWRQGHITARWLSERDIPVTMVVDSAVRHFINDMDMVLVGADTITANGAVINKIGTSQISLCAHEARTPFIVCAETYKFSRETLMGSLVEIEDRGPEEVADPLQPSDLPGVEFRNPVFDMTPPEYINSIITELGVISPYMATEVIREMFDMTGTAALETADAGSKWL